MRLIPPTPSVDTANPSEVANTTPAVHMTCVNATSLPCAPTGARSESTAIDVGRSAPAAIPITITPATSTVGFGASAMAVAATA